MHSVTEWVASIPDDVSPREGLAFIDVALADAREATDAIVAQFTGGTLPPPPWPQTPELATAIARMQGGQLMAQRAIELGNGDTKSPKASPRVLPLLDGGRVLYREIERMQRLFKEGTLTTATLPKLAARGLGWLLPTSGVGGLVALGAVLYLVHRYGDE